MEVSHSEVDPAVALVVGVERDVEQPAVPVDEVEELEPVRVGGRRALDQRRDGAVGPDHAEPAHLLRDQDPPVGKRRDREREGIEAARHGLDAKGGELALDHGARNRERRVDLEVRAAVVGALLRDQDREASNLRLVEDRGPARHARVREAAGDALRERGDRVTVAELAADQRCPDARALEALAVARGAVLGVERRERIAEQGREHPVGPEAQQQQNRDRDE
jgi:hypothetical protein